MVRATCAVILLCCVPLRAAAADRVGSAHDSAAHGDADPATATAVPTETGKIAPGPAAARWHVVTLRNAAFDLRAVDDRQAWSAPVDTDLTLHHSEAVPVEASPHDAGPAEVRDSARQAVDATLADHARTGPPPSALDALLVFHLDGQPHRLPIGLGGGVAGAVWEASANR